MCIFCVGAEAAPTSAPSAAAPAPGDPREFIVASFVCPVMFSVLGVNVYSYGVFVSAALGSAFLVFGVELRRARINLDEFNCFFVFLAGFAVGSKAHVAMSAVGAGEPLTWKALDIRSGHSFMGSQIGAVGFMLVHIMWNKVSVLALLDVLLPCCILGHFIGKCGCFLSGDGCFGPPADPRTVPWAMSFPNGQVPTRVPVHPTPIYEALCSLTVFLVVRSIFPLPPAPPSVADDEDAEPVGPGDESRFPKVGRRTALTLVLYGVERMLIEPFRRHPPITVFGGLTEYQALAIILLVIGLGIEAWVRRGSGGNSGRLASRVGSSSARQKEKKRA